MKLDLVTVERFRRDLLAITGALPDANSPLALAVSGGPDSMALLLLADAAFPGAIRVASVDHRLRSDSAAEALFVGEVCAVRSIPHSLLAPSNGLAPGNLHDQARSMRYALLHDWSVGAGAQWLATAHQRDDVAEGLLMRARRGAGVGGLAEMPSCRALGASGKVSLIRPLLDWSRAELAAIVSDAGIDAVQDPSNTHPRFDRSRIRALIAGTADLPADKLAMAARNLRHAEDALAWAADREWGARHVCADEKTIRLDPHGLPYELRRRLIVRAIAQIHAKLPDATPWREAGVDGLIATCDSGRTATLAGVLVRPAKHWLFTIAPPRRSH